MRKIDRGTRYLSSVFTDDSSKTAPNLGVATSFATDDKSKGLLFTITDPKDGVSKQVVLGPAKIAELIELGSKVLSDNLA